MIELDVCDMDPFTIALCTYTHVRVAQVWLGIPGIVCVSSHVTQYNVLDDRHSDNRMKIMELLYIVHTMYIQHFLLNIYYSNSIINKY